MSKKMKYSLMLSFFTLAFSIGTIVGDYLIYDTSPTLSSYLLVAAVVFLTFLTTSAGYDFGYADAKNE